jgi:hypothetical protein
MLLLRLAGQTQLCVAGKSEKTAGVECGGGEEEKDDVRPSNESAKLPELGRPRLQVTGHGPYCAEHTGCEGQSHRVPSGVFGSAFF